MKKGFFILAALLLVAVQCVYPYDAQLDESEENMLVVDGNVVVGSKATLSLSSTGKEIPALQDWWVEDDAGQQYTARLPYSDNIDMRMAPANRSYRIVILAGDKRYVSEFGSAPVPPTITNISFSANNSAVTCHVSFNGGPEATGYAAFTYQEVFEFHADFRPTYIFEPADSTVYELGPDNKPYPDYCWTHYEYPDEKVVDFSHLITDQAEAFPLLQFSRYNARNHHDYRIKVWGRTISKEEYDFRHALSLLQQGGNNLFNPNPGEKAGNIRCETNPLERVLGYVSYARNSHFEGRLDNRYRQSANIDDAYLVFPTEDMYVSYYFDLDYRPVYKKVSGTRERLGWAPLRCVDCVAAGGTLDIPPFNE